MGRIVLYFYINHGGQPTQTLGTNAQRINFIIELKTQLLDWDAKRYILFHRVLDASGQVAATNEAKMLGFNLHTRRPEAWGAIPAERLARIAEAPGTLATPGQAGQGIVLGRR